jgi:hypothetical protein
MFLCLSRPTHVARLAAIPNELANITLDPIDNAGVWRGRLGQCVRRCSPGNSLLCRIILYMVLAAVLIFTVRALCWVIWLEVRPC